MFRDVVMLGSCAAVSYLWLCVIASPLATSLRSVIKTGSDRTAWAAFALAAGGALLWTAIIAGALILGMMLEPRAGLAVLRSDIGWRGVSLGNIAWICQLVASARLPRLGATVETATALALVALVNDEAQDAGARRTALSGPRRRRTGRAAARLTRRRSARRLTTRPPAGRW